MAPQDWWNDWKRAEAYARARRRCPDHRHDSDATSSMSMPTMITTACPDSWELQFFGHLATAPPTIPMATA